MLFDRLLARYQAWQSAIYGPDNVEAKHEKVEIQEEFCFEDPNAPSLPLTSKLRTRMMAHLPTFIAKRRS